MWKPEEVEGAQRPWQSFTGDSTSCQHLPVWKWTMHWHSHLGLCPSRMQNGCVQTTHFRRWILCRLQTMCTLPATTEEDAPRTSIRFQSLVLSTVRSLSCRKRGARGISNVHRSTWVVVDLEEVRQFFSGGSPQQRPSSTT